jgi:hypothetical protein
MGQPIRITNPDPKLLKALADAGVIVPQAQPAPVQHKPRARQRQPRRRRYRSARPAKPTAGATPGASWGWILTVIAIVWMVLRAFAR